MGVENRVNISSLAKGLQKEGVTTQSTLLSGYGALKPELYALTSIFADRIITRSLAQRENRPPFGFVSIADDSPDSKDHQTETVAFLDDEDPFLSLGMSMRSTLIVDMMDEIKALEEGDIPDHKLQSVYSRYSQLLEAYHETIPGFVTPGINTAVAVMFGVLEVIPRVCDGDFDPRQLTQIAANSYPLIVKLASLHIDVFADLNTTIMDPFHPGTDELFVSFDPRFFRIGGGQNQRLVSSEDLLTRMKQLTDALNRSKDQHPSPTVNCPAIVNLGGGSPINRLWDWGVQTAQPIYNGL